MRNVYKLKELRLLINEIRLIEEKENSIIEENNKLNIKNNDLNQDIIKLNKKYERFKKLKFNFLKTFSGRFIVGLMLGGLLFSFLTWRFSNISIDRVVGAIAMSILGPAFCSCLCPMMFFADLEKFLQIKNTNIEDTYNKISEKTNQKNKIKEKIILNKTELNELRENKKTNLNKLKALIEIYLFEDSLKLDEDYINSLMRNTDSIIEFIEKEESFQKSKIYKFSNK